jgi:hypothetical protein
MIMEIAGGAAAGPATEDVLMHQRTLTRLAGAACLAALSLAPAAAQQLPPGGFAGGALPAPASPEAARAAEMAQEIVLLRLIAQHRVAREPLKQIRDHVAGALAELDTGDVAAAKELVAQKPLLSEAKKTLLGDTSLDTPTPQELAVAGTLTRLDGQRAGFLNELAQQVLQLLQGLSPEERAAFLALGQALVRQQRADQPGLLGLPFGPGGGADRLGRELDRLRSASPQDWERERTRFALQNSGIQGWWMLPGMLPTGSEARVLALPVAPGGGGPVGDLVIPGGPGGGPGGSPPVVRIIGTGAAGDTAGVVRVLGAGGPVQFNVQAPNLNDPAVQARIRPFLNAADQARGMAPAIYQQARDRLAQQLEQQRRQEWVNSPVTDEEALATLARLLASKTGLAALEAKLGR